MGVMIAAAVIGAAGAAYSANKSSKAAGKASTAQERAAQAQIDEQRRQYDQTRTDQAPWLREGSAAIGTLGDISRGDYSSFTASPDYNFALQQGQLGLDRGAAAKGRLFSGGYDADRIQFNQGMASQQFNNYRNSLQSLAGVGQNAAQSLGQFGQNAANQSSAAMGAAGDARASGYINSANAQSNFGNQIGQIAGNYFGQRAGQGWGAQPISQQPSSYTAPTGLGGGSLGTGAWNDWAAGQGG